MTTSGISHAAAALSAEQALTTATRLLDPQVIREAVPGLLGASLSQGLAGTALLHARLAATDVTFERAAARHWAEAARITSESGAGIGGIHSGPGALASSMIIGSGYLSDPERHRLTAARGVRWLAARAQHIAQWQHQRLAAGGSGTPWHVYDLINGLSGIGRVLLAADTAGHPDAEPGLRAARDTLTTMILTPDGPFPGWWRPVPENPHAAADPHNPDGANTGLAHGIAGPVAFLAACESAGHGDATQRAAIREAATWLLDWRDGHGWPPQVTRDNVEQGTATSSTRGRRDAWCYGTGGIGRALISAGDALGDVVLSEVGSAALAALADRPVDQWDTEGPTLCHGHAGVLRCAALTPATELAAARAVTSSFDSRHPYGFQHAQGGAHMDNPGLLTGAAGVALVLADQGALPAQGVPTPWDALLLLS
jgi:lantibiotic biosynthesis protein